MLKKALALLTAVTILGATFVGCSKKDEGTNKKYVIATDATYAPFEYEKDGKYIGIDMDLLDAIAKSENFQYELKPMNFKGIIPGMTSNQIDAAIAGMSITDERKKSLDFSEGYFDAGISIVVKAENDKIKSADDLKGKIFAVKKGTAGSKFAEDNKDKYGATIRYFDDSPSMFQEVINGNADVTFEDYPVIAYKISTDSTPTLKVVGDRLTKDQYGFAVVKGKNKELLDKFNTGLKKLKENGEYDKILSKYIKK
ncbi:transporter substrate-binding domain-containing protein [Clostridium sp. YIM B02505]|uniref:Transporter substrate-binding domain-containing protein n=1 Tax=Clostridium yunnanense TaxID=2800325 RepID=A0ABS1EVQ9_9CLOT|nr:transporter substrate-binding domain-containing protein [Clostridium yunnanense]MBK1813474.1 transporter substrate-binding domain-containing protein [Clostridium yunnanense]